MSIPTCEPHASALDGRNGRTPYFSHEARATSATACSSDEACKPSSRTPSSAPTLRAPTQPTTSCKPPRRPVSCAGTLPVDARPLPPSPTHRTVYSYPAPPRTTPPHSPPHTVLDRSWSRSSPILHRDDGSTWRLVERVTELFVLDVAPPPPPPTRRTPHARRSTPPPRLDALDDPNRTSRRPSAPAPLTAQPRSRTLSPSPPATPLSPRLAALAHTLRTLDAAERARCRPSMRRPALPHTPTLEPAVQRQRTSTSDLGLRLEGLAALFPGGVPRAVGLDEDEGDEGWDGQALKSAWSATSDEDEAESGSECGSEGEEGGPCEEDEDGCTSSGSSYVSDDSDEASRRGSRDSWQSAATTVSAYSSMKGGGRREEVEREMEQAGRGWMAWGAS